ncbi:anhydro-N-acetylmuramic acid kinase [Limnobacter humi]|uniref:Anhydro-N-acetylmuramic acid kinase n=1 Tax=Limnobacter humi TaxID=1778671 RepID=A0ABT1WH52_9BURK|nr:anhydro-N-acetylmuramic acid kinase [Limnobacter humi]MCQ8896852.1 anhydro-N-acetylmuramic acid kinase [Limnobacter humi]
MSGTSTDGVDVAALHWLPDGQLRFLGMVSQAFEPGLQSNLLALQAVPPVPASLSDDPLLFMLTARQALSDAYVDGARMLLSTIGLDSTDVRAFGVHGQTLRHRPDLGFTYQIMDAARVATRLEIHVVHDFRAKDVALSGQGAPLVPAFHRAWLEARGMSNGTGVLNLGGFSNLTLLGTSNTPVTGGDCGPANCLMDAWAWRTRQQTMDEDGLMAAAGHVDQALLSSLLSHPFLARAWPKSTGRDDFTLAWLDDCLAGLHGRPSDEDVMRTLLEFSVQCVVRCLRENCSNPLNRLVVCGGGVRNPVLMSALSAALAPLEVRGFDELGLPAQAVEACAFAWMAGALLSGTPANCVGVTGASQAALLGSVQAWN